MIRKAQRSFASDDVQGFIGIRPRSFGSGFNHLQEGCSSAGSTAYLVFLLRLSAANQVLVDERGHVDPLRLAGRHDWQVLAALLAADVIAALAALRRVEAVLLHVVARDLLAIYFGQPYKTPATRTVAKVDPSIYDQYVGKYELRPDFIMTVTREGNSLITQATGQPTIEIFPESETRFFPKVMDATIVFEKDAASVDLWHADLPAECTMVFGSETTGVPDDIVRAADMVVGIPMYGINHSFPVTVAAGIAMAEWTRRHYAS